MLSILKLKVLNPFRDCRQYISAIIIRDRASLHFVKHCYYLFETQAFLFQLVILVIAPTIMGNLFELITCNFWILNPINAVFSNPLSPIDFEFIDHWLRRWNIFIEIGVFYSRYFRSKLLYRSFKFQVIIFFYFHHFPLKLHFSKQFLIVKLATSFHASCSHRSRRYIHNLDNLYWRCILLDPCKHIISQPLSVLDLEILDEVSIQWL